MAQALVENSERVSIRITTEDKSLLQEYDGLFHQQYKHIVVVLMH